MRRTHATRKELQSVGFNVDKAISNDVFRAIRAKVRELEKKPMGDLLVRRAENFLTAVSNDPEYATSMSSVAQFAAEVFAHTKRFETWEQKERVVLRDSFARAYIGGMPRVKERPELAEEIATEAYVMADAMLVARAAKPAPTKAKPARGRR